jgi:predicted protein tyrosine phosphatase
MTPQNISLITICGLDELADHGARGVSHVLSILDPGWPEPQAFWAYDAHHRTTLHFHDIIAPRGDLVLPTQEHVEAILAFGQSLGRPAGDVREGHLLIHCHMGVSRSTAAMAMILAQADPEVDEERILSHLEEIRPQIWPNSLMIGYADTILGRSGRLIKALRRLHGRRLAVRPGMASYMRENGRGREVDMAIMPAQETR